MPDDRRSAKRICLPGLRATYESADGEIQEARVFNLSRSGLFLETAIHVPVGKRLSLEVLVAGESTPWPALGRIIWARPSRESSERPCGLGVKVIDAEDAVFDAIDALVEQSESVDGEGEEDPQRQFEQTIQGMGAAQIAEVPMSAASEPLVTPLITPRGLTRVELNEDPLETTPTGTEAAAEAGNAVDSLLQRAQTPAAPALATPSETAPAETAEPPALPAVQGTPAKPTQTWRGVWVVAGLVAAALAAWAFRALQLR